MKLSTVRLVGAAVEAPDLRQDLVAAHGLARALGEHAQELHLVERELVLLPAGAHRVRGEVHATLPSPRLSVSGTPAARAAWARRKMARMRAMSSFTPKGFVT